MWAALPLLFCGSDGAAIRLARDDGLPADQSLTDVLSTCGSGLAREDGLPANQSLADTHNSNCGSGLAREGGLTANQSLTDVADPIVGASLLAIAVYQSTPVPYVMPPSRTGSLPQGMCRVLTALFKSRQPLFLKATPPCVVAYNYARIRRLVSLVPGLYRFPVAANSATGFSDPTGISATRLQSAIFDMVAVRGRPSGLPGLIPPGSLTCVQLPPLLV